MATNNQPLWKVFEENIQKHSAYHRISIVKVPERVVIPKGKGPIRLKSPFDFIASIDGEAIFFDAKSESITDKFYFASKLKKEKSLQSQLDKLREFDKNGDVCGFLIWFKEACKITWVPLAVLEANLLSDEAGITWETPGVYTQEHSSPINLRELTKGVRKCKCQKMVIP